LPVELITLAFDLFTGLVVFVEKFGGTVYQPL
jgi:hypothetical protein